jgi:hypothetical protein
MINKKAEIGEGLAWIVATIAILFILFITLYAANILSDVKKLIDVKEARTKDLLVTKSLVAYLITEKEGSSIYEQLKQEQDLNEFNGKLAVRIFRDLYQRDYTRLIWMGLQKGNSYFGVRTLGLSSILNERRSSTRSGVPPYQSEPSVTNQIKLSDDKNIELILIQGK